MYVETVSEKFRSEKINENEYIRKKNENVSMVDAPGYSNTKDVQVKKNQSFFCVMR
jgi:hypothetical protein